MQPNAHIIFLKYPREGEVKTRLGREIGHKEAVCVYRRMVENLLRCSDSSSDTLLFIEPYRDLPEFKKWLREPYIYFPQTGADLGERMYNAFQKAFDAGYQKCVLTGSDIPELTGEIISDALEKLDCHDAVLGGAEDGGYYLIGFAAGALSSEPFNGIEWSTSQVFDQTMKKLHVADLSVGLTTVLSDLDTAEDLQFFRDRGLDL